MSAFASKWAVTMLLILLDLDKQCLNYKFRPRLHIRSNHCDAFSSFHPTEIAYAKHRTYSTENCVSVKDPS